MRVEVYWNLHRKCYSVRALKGEHKGRVILHATKLLLRDVKLVVREAGRQRVLKERRKNVHAFVRGTLTASTGSCTDHPQYSDRFRLECGWNSEAATSLARFWHGPRITYNPYKFSTFVVDVNGAPTQILEAPAVVMGMPAGFPVMNYLED